MKYAREEKAIKNFGKNLKRIRKLKNITQEQLAFSTGLELSQIGRIERGTINTSISNVFIIAKALNIKPHELWDF
jgi:transcriptional regulator with XRE-family HTH domain